MECEGYPENGATVDVRCRGVKRRLCGLRVSAVAAPRPPRRAAGLAAAADAPRTSSLASARQLPHAGDLPFMNEMDEITYWIYTKRAPCLMSYDEVAKKRAQHKPPAPPLLPVHSISDDTHTPVTPLKKKRKLSLLDDESDSGKGHENVFFDSSQQPLNQQTIISSGKSSDIDFNIKKSSIQEKLKRSRKNNYKTLHKKNNLVTSTPTGISALRRSKRTSRKRYYINRDSSYELLDVSLVNDSKSKVPAAACGQHGSVGIKPIDNTACVQKTDRNIDSTICIEPIKPTISNANYLHHNSSYELLNVSLVNGSKSKVPPAACGKHGSVGIKPIDNTACVQKTDRNVDSTMCIEPVKTNINNANGNFDDLSDVSGFTANYIRSTKIHSAKKGKKSKSKSNSRLLKESQPSEQQDLNKTLMCVNKSVNTGLQNTALNGSSESSQNRLNVVTTQKNRPAKISKSTSLLKFMDSRQIKNTSTQLLDLDTTRESSKLDTLQSPSNDTPRYPRRCRTSAQHSTPTCQSTVAQTQSPSQISRRGNQKATKDSRSPPLTRARSGHVRTSRHSQALLVLSASSEKVSSAVTMNVASPAGNASTPKHNTLRKSRNKLESTIKSKRRKRTVNKSEHSGGRESLRDKSGFAACFSDSEGDDKPLRAHKFFRS